MQAVLLLQVWPLLRPVTAVVLGTLGTSAALAVFAACTSAAHARQLWAASAPVSSRLVAAMLELVVVVLVVVVVVVLTGNVAVLLELVLAIVVVVMLVGAVDGPTVGGGVLVLVPLHEHARVQERAPVNATWTRQRRTATITTTTTTMCCLCHRRACTHRRNVVQHRAINTHIVVVTVIALTTVAAVAVVANGGNASLAVRVPGQRTGRRASCAGVTAKNTQRIPVCR